MAVRFLILVGLGLGLCCMAHAAPVVLEFPSGRFRENNPPNFFKWSLNHKVSTLSLKVFRQTPADQTSAARLELISRFDFTQENQSLSWPNGPFAQGRYTWILEGYDDKNPSPLFSESTDFEVEPLRGLDLRTLRYGAQLGFGRGPYRSRDMNYDLNFETTPTSYGLLFRGGSEKDIWDLSVLGSDFTVRGAVRRSAEISGAYSWRLTENNRHKVDVFFGGSSRVQQAPRIISPDGTNISESTLAMIDLGLTASIQRRFDFQITLYSQGTVDFPIYASERYDFDTKQLSYKASAGLLFGLFWPLGFGGELQYRVDRSATKSGSNVIEINQSGLGIMANMMYSL